MEGRTKRKIFSILVPSLLGIIMLIPSAFMHEMGHAAACIWQGLDLIEINLISNYIICSDSDNQTVHIMGGAVGGASMLPFLLVGRIRRYLPISLGLVTAATTQLFNMMLEGFSNPTYRAFELENLVFAFGVVIIISSVFLLHSRLLKYYSERLEDSTSYE